MIIRGGKGTGAAAAPRESTASASQLDTSPEPSIARMRVTSALVDVAPVALLPTFISTLSRLFGCWRLSCFVRLVLTTTCLLPTYLFIFNEYLSPIRSLKWHFSTFSSLDKEIPFVLYSYMACFAFCHTLSLELTDPDVTGGISLRAWGVCASWLLLVSLFVIRRMCVGVFPSLFALSRSPLLALAHPQLQTPDAVQPSVPLLAELGNLASPQLNIPVLDDDDDFDRSTVSTLLDILETDEDL